MDKLVYPILMMVALILGSCRGVEPDGEVENTSPSGSVALRIRLPRSSNLQDKDITTAISGDAERKMQVRIYVFRSEVCGDDERFICVRPNGGDEGREYLEIDLEDEEFSGGLDLMTSGDSYFRFLAVGVNGGFSDSGDHADAVDTGDSGGSGNGSKVIPDTDESEIDCRPGTRWNDVMIRNVAVNPSGRVEEIFAGVAMRDKTSGSTDFFVPESGGSLNVEIELKRAVAGVMLCVTGVPSEIVSDFSWKGSEAEEMTVEQGNSYGIDRIEIISVGRYDAFNPASTIITGDYKGVISHLVGIDTESMENLSAGSGETRLYCNGGFIYPARLADKSAQGEGLILDRSSLYLVVSTRTGGADNGKEAEERYDGVENGFRYVPLKVIPIRHSRSAVESEGAILPEPNEDSRISTDGFRYNLLGNHFYCLGRPESPVDLSKIIKEGNALIEAAGNYQADVDIPF